MNDEAILARVENLSDPHRVQAMLLIGVQATSEPETAAALETLAAGGFYERRLALLACSGSRDGSLPLALLSDPSRLLRGLAFSLIPILCTDAQILQALKSAPSQGRAALLGRLVRRRRRGPADEFLSSLAATDDPQLGLLLSYGSAEVVRPLLERVLPRYGTDDWKRLARRHPDIALEALLRQAKTLIASDARLRLSVNAVLPLLADLRPGPALELVQLLLRHDSISRIALQPLANRLPNEVAALTLASEDRAGVRFESLAYALTSENLLTLLRRQPSLLGHPVRWMRRLSQGARQAVYAVAGLSWRSSEGILDPSVAALLPGTLRESEGRRHLALPALATRMAARLTYASLLPWDEAKAALDTSIRNPDAEMRAVALAALIASARYQRERLPDVITLITARANEQDPVRRAMLSAVAALPPARWAEGDLNGLSQVISDALSAADLSPATANAAEKLVVALIPFHPDWTAGWLGTLAKERGQIAFSGLGDRLSDDDVRRIAPALTPVLASWETREREIILVQAARSLGRRLRVFSALAEMLERVVTITPNSYIASQALAVLSEHLPDRLALLVPSLIEKDASCVTLPVVYQYLHRKRQDLLSPFLGQTAYSGRFSTGRTRFVLPLTSGFERWTPRQQAIFADTLDRVTRDTARDTPSVFFVIKQLAALPAVISPRLFELARPAEKLAVRDAALRALARLDGGQGVPALVEALDDARARIAIYALRTTLLEMPPDAALRLLLGVPREKVTVAKEVVRLLGELKTPDAYPALLAFGAQDLHRDVRIAVLRALWDHLEQDTTWPFLEGAAADPEPAVASGVVRIPTDRLSLRARLRLVALLGTLLGHPDPKIRLDVLARCVELPLPDPEELLLPRLLPRLGSRLPDESAAAARAVFATYAENQGAVVSKAIAAISQNRRALQAVISALQVTLSTRRGRQEPVVRAVIGALESDPLTASLRAALAIYGLPWNEVAFVLFGLAEKSELHPDALAAAIQALAGTGYRADREGLSGLEAALAAAPDELLRRLALASLTMQATAEGWSAEFRNRLEIYRRDFAPLVSAAAQFTFPPDEEPA